MSEPLDSDSTAQLTGNEINQAAEVTAFEVSEEIKSSSIVDPPTGDARRFPGKSTEEIAAIKIQTTFRGYLVIYDWKISAQTFI